MEKIKLSDIDFSKLEKLNQQGNTSNVYRFEDKCIKIYKGIFPDELYNLYKKFELMDGLKIEGVISPEVLIFDNGRFAGYTMEYFDNSVNLNLNFAIQEVNVKKIFEAVKKACLILRRVHENNIILQDISFDNILINNDEEVKIIDIDGCIYNGFITPFISQILKKYLLSYKKEKVNITNNIDKLSMMLSLYYILYLKELQNISSKRYNSLSENIITLQNMKPYADLLKNKKELVPELPYLDELICDSDDYIIDRWTQISLIRKLEILRLSRKRL